MCIAVGQFALLRAAYESAGSAIWLLGPEGGDDPHNRAATPADAATRQAD
jgi:hypothetical protein